MVVVESMVSGHKFNTVRERLGDKVETIRFDPYIQKEAVYRELKKIRSINALLINSSKSKVMRFEIMSRYAPQINVLIGHSNIELVGLRKCLDSYLVIKSNSAATLEL
ncbi:hypothetical protein GQX74_008830 [Glossina fuscipes]|nr:hypothetical protein GQX74_008830 [Glossina fuscipes]